MKLRFFPPTSVSPKTCVLATPTDGDCPVFVLPPRSSFVRSSIHGGAIYLCTDPRSPCLWYDTLWSLARVRPILNSIHSAPGAWPSLDCYGAPQVTENLSWPTSHCDRVAGSKKDPTRQSRSRPQAMRPQSLGQSCGYVTWCVHVLALPCWYHFTLTYIFGRITSFVTFDTSLEAFRPRKFAT